MKNVIELIRVSTEQQAADDRASIPAQRAINRRTCAQHGLQIIKAIEISDVSGASVRSTPEVTELLELMKSPDVHGVVTREFSRLMRPENMEDYALLQAFADSGTILYLPDGPLDFNSKFGRLMGTIRAAIAGLERTELLERVWAAKEEKRRRGELAQSHIVLPWGVGYEADKGFYYKPEAERVREAFRQVLAGNHNYRQLSQMVGVTPRGMHTVLRNPIWMGWRVIDKKRDVSASGRYPGKDGRQSDRRKVLRAADEVIRIRVISEPLISECDFRTVQQIMDRKEHRHWRSRPDYEHRFTYNGFLTCSTCGEVIHTALARRDYYACKGRRGPSHSCTTKYMSKEKLEGILDELLSDRLTDRTFLEHCVGELSGRAQVRESALQTERLRKELRWMKTRRERIVDSFIDGTISKRERDRRLRILDHEIAAKEDLVLDEESPSTLNFESLVKAFAPLAEWNYWSREQKRSVLAALMPDIRVADYHVESLGLNSGTFSNEVTRKDMDSWQLPA